MLQLVILWSKYENCTTINNALFASLIFVLLLLLIVIYDCDGMYNETIIMDCMPTYMLLNLLSCPYPSVPPRIFTTLLFQAYIMYSWVMLLIVLYEGVMLE